MFLDAKNITWLHHKHTHTQHQLLHIHVHTSSVCTVVTWHSVYRHKHCFISQTDYNSRLQSARLLSLPTGGLACMAYSLIPLHTGTHTDRHTHIIHVHNVHVHTHTHTTHTHTHTQKLCHIYLQTYISQHRKSYVPVHVYINSTFLEIHKWQGLYQTSPNCLTRHTCLL